tara:strand:+ start:143 stop:598 length:456 start_codon:yes stop_codon:yes gene_type:complete
MSQIPELMGGRALEHDISVEPGKGFAVKNQTPLVTALSGATNLLAFKSQAFTVDSSSPHTLLVTGTAGTNQTKITSNVLVINPTDNRNVDLPAEASCTGLLLIILNSSVGSSNFIVLRNDAGDTILTIGEAEGGVAFCDGTTWHGLVGGAT